MEGMEREIGVTPEAAKRMFQRTLASWAVDALRIRRAGLDRPKAYGRGSAGAARNGVRTGFADPGSDQPRSIAA